MEYISNVSALGFEGSQSLQRSHKVFKIKAFILGVKALHCVIKFKTLLFRQLGCLLNSFLSFFMMNFFIAFFSLLISFIG